MYMKFLVTGSKGQLGAALHNALEEIMPGCTVYTDVDELDITDTKALEVFIQCHDISVVINCAAYTAVDLAETESALCYRLNSDAVTGLASIASKLGVKVLHISTDYVFDGISNIPYRESDKVNPLSNYGASKRKGEVSLLAMCPDAIIIRTSWLYSDTGRNFVNTMLRLGKERSELTVVSDQIGTPTYAGDLADAIVKILTARQWLPGIYHYSNEGVCSWYDFAKAIHRFAGLTQCKIIPVNSDDYTTPAQRPHYSVLDKSLIKKTFGIEIPYWADSLEKCIKIIAKK